MINAPKSSQKQLLSVVEVAQILGISRVAVFKKIQKGTLPARKVGRAYIVAASDIPAIIGGVVGEKDRRIIDEAVRRTFHEYGETLRLLGKE